ncbi:Major intrinsic protein [Dillenia turbinata]|uniref:Major intrinsic protein n=1 Tax=Dillenia turbinata TaxID=194707 RepID=A0AAN8VN77_9MAGN
MAASPSIIVETSSKLASPKDLSIMMEEEKKSHSKHQAFETNPSCFQKILAELMGTYILIFAGCGAALVDRVQRLTIIGIAMVSGLVLMAAIYTLGHVSGAHFNPAVSIAFAATKKLPWKQVPMYVMSQLLGSILACLTLRVLFHGQGDIHPTLTHYTSPTTDLEALSWEFIISFILMFTICGAGSDKRAKIELSGVAIGATLAFNILIAGPITGASMNPARSIGPAVASGAYKNLWVFVIAPTSGALVAAMVYGLLQETRPDSSDVGTKSVYNDLYLHGHA